MRIKHKQTLNKIQFHHRTQFETYQCHCDKSHRFIGKTNYPRNNCVFLHEHNIIYNVSHCFNCALLQVNYKNDIKLRETKY